MKLFKSANENSDYNIQRKLGSKPPINRKGILIVDDSRFSRNILRDILKNEGYLVIGEAGDGLEAIELTKQKKPEYIFMDVEMPKLDGLGAISRILEIDSGVHIIMCTALGQKNIMVEAAKAGAKDFVIKPFKKENITGVLYDILSTKQKDSQIIPFNSKHSNDNEKHEKSKRLNNIDKQKNDVHEDSLVREVEEVPDILVEMEEYLNPLETDDDIAVVMEETLDSTYNEDSLQETKDNEVLLTYKNESDEKEDNQDADRNTKESLETAKEAVKVTEQQAVGAETEEDEKGETEKLSEINSTVKNDEEHEKMSHQESDTPSEEENKTEKLAEGDKESPAEEITEAEKPVAEETEVEKPVAEETESEKPVTEETDKNVTGEPSEFEKEDTTTVEENSLATGEVAEEAKPAEAETLAKADDKEVHTDTGYSYLWSNRFGYVKETVNTLYQTQRKIPVDRLISLESNLDGIIGSNHSEKLMMLGFIHVYYANDNRLQQNDMEFNAVRLKSYTQAQEKTLHSLDLLDEDEQQSKEMTMADIVRFSGNKLKQSCQGYKMMSNLYCLIDDLVKEKAERILG